MYNINFEQLQTQAKKCLYISNNKAVTRNKNLYSFMDILNNESYSKFYCEVEFRKDYSSNKNVFDYARLYVDLDIVLYEFNVIYNNTTLIELIEYFNNNNFTYEVIKNNTNNKLNNNRFINVAEIKLAEIMQESKEYIDTLKNARENFYKLREQEEQEKQRQREIKEKQEQEKKQLEINTLIKEAEQKIINQEQLFNEDIETESGNTTSIFLMLFKKYNINIPLKTQGWINKALYCALLNNNKYSYQYYNSSKDSTVFSSYLQDLIIAIKEAYNVLSQEEKQQEEKRQQEQINNNNYIESIANINFKKSNNPFRDEIDWRTETRNGNKITFTEEQAKELMRRMYKALKIDDIEYRMKIYFSLPYNAKTRLNASNGNIIINVEAMEYRDKIQYKFTKQYTNKDDYYIYKEIA